MNSKRYIITTATAVALTAIGLVMIAQRSDAKSTSKNSLVDNPSLVKRGEYLVHHVGLCTDCHSPRGSTGEFIAARHLTGAPIPFAPSVPMPWATAAPNIAGLPEGWNEAAMVNFLMTGERPNNLPPPRPPMPPYRLNQTDAEAVVAYVHSLAGTK